MTSEAENLNQFLDEQLLDLEQKFNQFMKEMEDDLIFPTFNNTLESWDDDFLLQDDPIEDKSLIKIDAHTTALCVTGSITLSILVYLGMVLSQ